METQKNSQLEAASLGKPGVFTGTTFGRGLSRTGLLPKGFFVPICRETHSTYISIGKLCKEGFQSSRERCVRIDLQQQILDDAQYLVQSITAYRS